MDTLRSLHVFCAVAELKSFTAAADRLGLSPAMASKHVMHLDSGMNSSGSLTVDGPRGEKVVKFRPVMQSENEIMLHLAALEGMGLVFLPAWMTETDIAEGRLEKVLPDTAKFNTTLHAVYPSKKYLSAKVRTFIDFLVSRKNLCSEFDGDGLV
jgi:DNA-binding transcriptional LysR family regulator